MPRQQTPPRRCKDRVLSRREIESLIADQETIVIVDGKVLRLDSWLSYHPGGDKAIMHMVGRDATDEVNAYVGNDSLLPLLLLLLHRRQEQMAPVDAPPQADALI